MKRLVFVLFAIMTSLAVSAGVKKLPNGEVASWQDKTGKIEYESYRVEILLSGKCDFNVWGEIKVNKKTQPFMIESGETKGFADFEGLKNGESYNITVTIKNEDPKKDNK